MTAVSKPSLDTLPPPRPKDFSVKFTTANFAFLVCAGEGFRVRVMGLRFGNSSIVQLGRLRPAMRLGGEQDKEFWGD